MSLQDLASVAERLAALTIIVSLLFVGYQIRQNTNQLQRSEHNSTMEQWSKIRVASVENRDVADIWRSGLHEKSVFPPPFATEIGAALDAVTAPTGAAGDVP